MINTNFTNVLEEFHQNATSAGLEYMLIGGFAVSYWGTPRFTADIDYVIAMDSFEKAKNVVLTLGYELAFLHPKKSFAHFVKKELPGFRIDFMLVDDETWLKLQNKANRIIQIRAIMAETERWLKLEWVQKKLEKRLAEIFKGNSEPFTI